MITVRFGGAVDEITGAAYWVETPQARFLVDFGLFQGGREAQGRNRVLEPVVADSMQAVLLTHAHVDHSGRLPMLAALGARAPVFGTPATLELAEVLLQDIACIAEEDTALTNRILRRAGRRERSPLYTREDVDILVRQFQPLPYGEPRTVAPGVRARFYDAGQTPGAASLELRIERPDGSPATLVFAGSLGARENGWAPQRPAPAEADIVFLEATHGDRVGPSRADSVAAFHALLRRVVAKQQRVIVPAFAVGAAQSLLFELAQAFREQVVPPFPVYLDSPFAERAGALYTRYAEGVADDVALSGRRGQIPETLRIISSAAESRQLNEDDGCCLIIASAGMGEGGRVLHHLRHALWREQTLVLLPGTLAPGTLGRQLADGAREVEIFGETIAVRAQIARLEGFPGEADRNAVLDWFAPLATSGAPRVVLTHGDDAARAGLAHAVQARFGITAELPARGGTTTL